MSNDKEIIALVDYKGQFGSKSDSTYYRSGMDINMLSKYFNELGCKFTCMGFSEINMRTIDINNKCFIYTSQEDPEYYYKGYIEDIIYGLELLGATVMPKFKFLRANNNKVFMEILRDQKGFDAIQGIKSSHFGSICDFEKTKEKFEGKVVVKKAAGAKSHGVFLASSKEELFNMARKASSAPCFYDDLKDIVRPYLHKGYVQNTRNRKKFIVQNFIEGLKNDWKVLVFGDKYFLEFRGVRTDDFRASGSQKFFLNDDIPVEIPQGIFEFAETVRNLMDTPHLSLDIGYINNKFYLFEFQALYFSSYAQTKSSCYYIRKNHEFIRVNNNYPLEFLYAESIIEYVHSPKN